MPASRTPVFSLIWYGKNRIDSARETIAALRQQSLGDFELLVEDCGSTDGTVEAFLDAAKGDSRLRVFRRSWRNRADALLSAIRRSCGDFVMVCPNEGTFVPDALAKLQAAFAVRPETGGICTAGTLLRGTGEELKRSDIVALLFTPYSLVLPAMAFRKKAMAETGIYEGGWLANAFDQDLFCRIAISRGLSFVDEQILTQPGKLLQMDGLDVSVTSVIADRLQLVSSIFSSTGFLANSPVALPWEAKVNQINSLMEQYGGLALAELKTEGFYAAAATADGIRQTLMYDHRTLRSLHRLLCSRSRGIGPLEGSLQKHMADVATRSMPEQIKAGYRVWNFPVLGKWLSRKIITHSVPSTRFHADAPSWESMYADLYAMVASRYEGRGQIDVALEMWERARPPDDAAIDSLAVQAMLKSPTATDEGLAIKQREWVRRHARGSAPVPPRRPAPGRKAIRIGYHCSFMDSDTIRNMMREVIAAHDREKFEIYGYAPNPFPDDLSRHLNVWRYTPGADYSDAAFAELVRSDEIDVFVELSGFSPGHRFGAMALRCAPVQVSFLNHTGSSQVPNVDYVISDEICMPSGSSSERFYSEKIWRLPGCFFCFDYSKFDEPQVLEPPVLTNGYITFGCFGSGGKISRELVAIWAELLRRVPESRLYLQNPQLAHEADRGFMRDCFKAAGIPANRLIVEPGVDRKQLIINYGLVDISLDTWPYAGGNTIAESLWHGVPVVTYRGDRFSSTYGASLLAAVGCPELVGDTPEHYIEVAAKLAAEPDKLLYLRKNLRRMSLEYGLGDSKLFARRIEEAFVKMVANVPAA